MKDKVLRLCKRLDKFTLDEIGTISELNSEVLLPLLEMFVKNKKLIKKGKIYQYNKNASSYLAKNRLPQRYQHHSKQDNSDNCIIHKRNSKDFEYVSSVVSWSISFNKLTLISYKSFSVRHSKAFSVLYLST